MGNETPSGPNEMLRQLWQAAGLPVDEAQIARLERGFRGLMRSVELLRNVDVAGEEPSFVFQPLEGR